MILYEGSNHSGTGNIVVIATGVDAKCSNRKTGDMVQIWILPADELPTEAVKSGGDELVCGTCPLRPENGGGCYVNVGRAPNNIWRRYKRGGYDYWDEADFRKPVRIGAYGDVAEMPWHVARWIYEAAVLGYTCYTHMWRDRPDLKDIAMASVETMVEYIDAKRMGWSTFRVTDPNGDFITEGEVLCPASRVEEMQCEKCMLCCGTGDKRRLSIHIPAHGTSAKRVHQKREE